MSGSAYGGQASASFADGLMKGYGFVDKALFNNEKLKDAERTNKVKDEIYDMTKNAEMLATKRAEDIMYNSAVAKAGGTPEQLQQHTTEQLQQLTEENKQMKSAVNGGIARNTMNALYTQTNIKDRDTELQRAVSIFKQNPSAAKSLGIKDISSAHVVNPNNKKEVDEVMKLAEMKGWTIPEDGASPALQKNILDMMQVVYVDGVLQDLASLTAAIGAPVVMSREDKETVEAHYEAMSSVNTLHSAGSEGLYFEKTGSKSVADRFNNAGNIRYGDFAAARGGKKGNSKETQAIFDTWEHGIDAQRDLLTSKTYRGLTGEGVINKWAGKKPNDGNRNYIDYVQSRTGMDMGSTVISNLNPQDLTKFMQAKYEFESGNRQPGRIYGGTASKTMTNTAQPLVDSMVEDDHLDYEKLNILQSLAGVTVTKNPKDSKKTALMRNYDWMKETFGEDVATATLIKPTDSRTTKQKDYDFLVKNGKSPDEANTLIFEKETSQPAKMKEIKALQSMVNPTTGEHYTQQEAMEKVYATAYAKNQKMKTDTTEKVLDYKFDPAQPAQPNESEIQSETVNSKLYTSKLQKDEQELKAKADVLPGLYRLRDKLADKKWESGVIDKAINWATSIASDDIARMTIEQIRGDASISYEAAAYLKAMSGASATDAEFQEKLKTLAGTADMQPSERRARLDNFIEAYTTGIKASANSLGNSGLPVSARKVLSGLEKQKPTQVDKGVSIADKYRK
jgi:hypothetical protein